MKGKHLTELDHHLQYEHLQELHNRSFLEIYQLNRRSHFHIYFAIEFGLFQIHQPHMHQLYVHAVPPACPHVCTYSRCVMQTVCDGTPLLVMRYACSMHRRCQLTCTDLSCSAVACTPKYGCSFSVSVCKTLVMVNMHLCAALF